MPHAAESLPESAARSDFDRRSPSAVEPSGTKPSRSVRSRPSQPLSTLFRNDGACGDALALREGDIFAGQYRVLELIGVGGMGAVVSARYLDLDVRVAIKLLLPHLCSENDAIAQFAREVCAVAQIDNEHVARVFDVGALDNGTPYMVMELLEGEDLEAWLHHHGPLPVDQAVDIVLQACEAIAEAHALGIVHRDVKPSNLFVTRRDDGSLCIKVLDFGISIMTGRGKPEPTPGECETASRGSRSIAGTPIYMSPEQMDAPDEVDGRTDIWALGICLYELITGLRPFAGRTLPAIRCTIGTDRPPPMRASRPDVPVGIEPIVARCLAKRRHCRYRDIAELALALRAFAPRRAWASVDRIRRIGERARASAPGITPAVPSRESVLHDGISFARSPSKSRSSIVEAAAGLAERAQRECVGAYAGACDHEV